MIKPREGSLFVLLARSPWWVSLLIAGALFAVMRHFLPDVLAAATTLPFVGIAAYAAWLQLRTPSARRISETMDSLRQMPWPQFSALITTSFQREGYEVAPSKSGAADFELRKSGYSTLLCCKRWKVVQTGIAPLRDLFEATQALGARDCCFVTAGDLTATARTFVAEKGIRLVNGVDLVRQIGKIPKTPIAGAAGK